MAGRAGVELRSPVSNFMAGSALTTPGCGHWLAFSLTLQFEHIRNQAVLVPQNFYKNLALCSLGHRPL
jgi:hypothetical protein